VAQEKFDQLFPGYRTQQLTMVIQSNNGSKVTDQQVAEIRNDVDSFSGFTEKSWQERPCPTVADNPCVAGPNATSHPKDASVRVIQNGLVNPNDSAKKINELRAISAPKGLTVLVGGTPALEQDAIHGIFSKLPLMLVILLTTTTLLMFLAFGSLVLPIKATVMSALTLGSTMGILTWIFVDGHFAKLLNFTPTPLTAPVIGLIIAVVFGLSTDYEVFLVSRMVEARARGMSTAEAIRIGTAATGRIITAAATVLAVVAGSFIFSDLVMMKYLAFGLMAALLLDATVIRMFLVPSVMKLLGDDCWWAPMWMKRLQNRIGLGEIHLPDERKRPAARTRADRPAVAAPIPAATTPRPPHDPTHPGAEAPAAPPVPPRPRPAGPPPRPGYRPPAQDKPSAAGTTKMRAPGRPEPKEPPTTRFSAQKNASPSPVPGRPPTPPPPVAQPPRGEDREIESWLSELRAAQPNDRPADPRGTTPPPSKPSADHTRAMPVPKEHPSGRRPKDEGLEGEATTAIPTPPRDEKDPDVATQKPNPRGQATDGRDRPRQRRGGGLSAQDLLRREGRI
jgi:trehalose monomycolate/heme transporter